MVCVTECLPKKNTTSNYVKSVNHVDNLRHVHSNDLHRGTVLHGVRENVPGSMTSVSQVLGLNLELSTLYALPQCAHVPPPPHCHDFALVYALMPLPRIQGSTTRN